MNTVGGSTPYFVTTEEAARHIGCSRGFLYRRRKYLPGAIQIGRNLRWDITALITGLAQGSVLSLPAPQAGQGVSPQLRTLISKEEYACLREAKRQMDLIKRILDKRKRRPFPIALGLVSEASEPHKILHNS